MNLEEVIQSDKVDFSGIPSSYYLIGLLSAFENRFQAMADSMMQEISWKQFFAIICINMCKEPPTLSELSDILGSSHQNVKQILLKLEKKGFIRFEQDEADKRKQRIVLTEECRKFCEKNDDMSQKTMMGMFEGIPEKDIKTTIKTIITIEKNLKGLSENE
jgi:DNA-binding MarR family transcriptional regulator